MSRLERFGLYSGILGVVADFIGIALFMAGVIATPSAGENAGEREAPTAAIVISILLLLYGWLWITWYAVRRKYLRNLNSQTPDETQKSIFRTTVTFGAILSPLYILIFIIVVAYESEVTIHSNLDLFTDDTVFGGLLAAFMAFLVGCLFVGLTVWGLITEFYPEMGKES